MSGGHYDYNYGYMATLAMNMKSDCETRATVSESGLGYHQEAIAPDILAHMQFVADQIEKLAMAAHDIEWFMSGDYGDDTLRERCESWGMSAHLRPEGCQKGKG